MSRNPWPDALADPAFRQALDEGLADIAAGRVKPFTPFVHRVPRPVGLRAQLAASHDADVIPDDAVFGEATVDPEAWNT